MLTERRGHWGTPEPQDRKALRGSRDRTDSPDQEEIQELRATVCVVILEVLELQAGLDLRGFLERQAQPDPLCLGRSG